ncbi:MAG: alpha/beta hydrolase [Rhodospirillaceae bacterium]|nr:alpha/beta hydrolase [Rhodospirillaceae bacterium]
MASDPAGEDYRAASVDMGPERWIDVAGIRTRYFAAGAGPALVFFHGGQYGSEDGSTARAWDVNFGPLARYLTVISVDRLGQGFTANPPSDEGYTMDASVRHAAYFLRLLGKGPYFVAGHSRGGYLVTRLALENPDLVAGCISVASGSLSPGTSRTHLLHSNLPPWSVRANVRAWYERYAYDARFVTDAFLDEPVAVVGTENFRIAREKMLGGLARRLFLPALARQKRETHRWLLDKGMPCPTLVCWGYHDPGAIFENGRQLVEMYMRRQKRTELCLFNRAGHFVFREYPAQFNRAVHAFVAAYA